MKVKSLIVLVIVAVSAVLTAVWLKQPQESMILIGQELVPELKQNINQVTGLRVTKAGNQTVAEIQRTDRGWVVSNKANYPADMGRIRETLLLLANARLIEEKTADPDYYGRLGIQDIATADATGVQLDIQGLSQPFSLLVGKSASGGAGGAYVRRPGNAHSFQIDNRLPVPATTKDWLDRSLLDIAAARIQAIGIRQPDGQMLNLEKSARDQANFTVLDIPQGQSLKADTVANPLANGLAGLWLEDVFPAGEVKPAAAQWVDATYRTFDGLVVTARIFEADNKHFAQFKADFDEAQVRRFARPPTGAQQSSAPLQGSDSAQPVAVRDEAKRLTERLSPWVFVISAYKYDTLAKRMDHLLKSAPPEAEPVSAAPGEEAQPEEEEEAPVIQPEEEEEAPVMEDNSPTEGESEDAAPQEPEEDAAPQEPEEETAPQEPDEDAVPQEPEEDAVPQEPEEDDVPQEPEEETMESPEDQE